LDNELGKCNKCGLHNRISRKNASCRLCKNEYERERTKKNPEHQKKLQKAKYNRLKIKYYEYRKKRIEKDPEKEREYQRKNYKRKKDSGFNLTRYEYDKAKKARLKWQNKFPDKYKCQYKMYNAIKSGKLIRPKICSICKLEKKIQGHHADYCKPLDVIWCCITCHAELDRKRRREIREWHA
jgi:hypothetical protein